jgi:hypothetical protein
MAFPTKDSELVNYSTNWNTRISSSATDYGLTNTQATQYGTLHTAWISAYDALAAAREAGTRSEALTSSKTSAKRNLLAFGRTLYKVVQSAPSVSNEKKIELGVHVRDTIPTPAPPPGTAPVLSVVSVTGRRARVKLKSAIGDRKGRPLGTIGAQIYSCVSDDVPTAGTQWHFEGATGKNLVDVVFPDSVANGATVWFTAVWFNGSKQTGPNAAPVSTNLQGGAAVAA